MKAQGLAGESTGEREQKKKGGGKGEQRQEGSGGFLQFLVNIGVM